MNYDEYISYNTSELELQTTKTRLPWILFFFVLAIFAISTPFSVFDFGRTHGVAAGSIEAGAEMMAGENKYRQAALFVLGCFSLIIITHSARHRLRINGLLGWLVLFYVGWSCLSVTWSNDQFFTMKRVGTLVLLFVGALGIAKRLTLREIVVLALVVTGITLFISFVMAVRYNQFKPWSGNWRFGNIIHPVQQGWNCGLLAIAAFIMSKSTNHPRGRVFYLGLALIALIFCYMTRSRMPIAASFTGFAVAGSLTVLKRHQVLVVLGLVVLGCLGYFMLGAIRGQEAIFAGRGFSWSGRIELWTELFGFADARPLLGHGYNSMMSPTNVIEILYTAGWFAPSTHSGYFEALLGIGWIGFIAFVLMLLLAIIKSLNISISGQTPENAFTVGVLVWLACNLVTESVIIVRPIFPAFFCFVLLARLGLLEQEWEE